MGRVFHKQVHGILYKNADGTDRQKIIRDCSEGEELRLIPEPNNPFDSDAIKVCRMNGEQIGYWPGNDGQMIGQIERGWRFQTTIEEIYSMPENSRKHGVSMRVEVLSMANGKQPAELPKHETRQPSLLAVAWLKCCHRLGRLFSK